MMTFLAFVSIGAATCCALLLWRALREERRRSDARVAALATAIDGPRPPGLERPGGPPLFDAGRASAMQGRPLLKVAFGFAAAVAVIVLVAMVSDNRPDAPAPATAAERTQAAPLELLSMRHTQSGDGITVTGLVRNPGTAPTARVIAVVLAFDRRGDFIASGRSPLEFPVLGRGEESPFQVTIAKAADVGRYRVSFRTEAGVVRHVDRRNGPSGQIAAN